MDVRLVGRSQETTKNFVLWPGRPCLSKYEDPWEYFASELEIDDTAQWDHSSGLPDVNRYAHVRGEHGSSNRRLSLPAAECVEKAIVGGPL